MREQILTLILLAITASATHAQNNEPSRPPIIDVHMHVYAKDERWTHKVPNPVTGQPLSANTEQTHMQATLAEMKKYNIVKAVVSNEYEVSLRWKAASPDRILVSYSFNDPSSVNLAFLRKEIVAGRLMALGEIGLQYAGINPNDPKLEPLFALAEELDIPIAIHMGLGPPGTPYQSCCPNFRTTLGNPQLLEPLLVKHPKLRLNIMHAGYPYLQEMNAILYMYPQVYADLGVIDWILSREDFHEYLRALVRAGYGKRLMFGSDQMVWPEAIGMAVEGIESAAFLTEEQKRDIFHDNAVRFFRLDKQ